jgi:hypothetical protein
MNHKECPHKQRCKDAFGGVCPGCKTPEEKILEIRDTLIELNRRWNERGPHATWDSPVIDMCILELDKLVNG